MSFHGGILGGDGNVAASEDIVDPGSDDPDLAHGYVKPKRRRVLEHVVQL